MNGNVTVATLGKAGDYSDATSTNNTVSVRTATGWKALGIKSYAAVPTIIGTGTGPQSMGDAITINGTTVTTTGTTLNPTVTDINNASVTGVTAAPVNGKIEIYGASNTASNQIVIATKWYIIN